MRTRAMFSMLSTMLSACAGEPAVQITKASVDAVGMLRKSATTMLRPFFVLDSFDDDVYEVFGHWMMNDVKR